MGIKKDWPIWSERFLARGDLKGYKLGEVRVSTDNEFSEMESDSAKVQAKSIPKSNKDVFIDLFISIAAI